MEEGACRRPGRARADVGRAVVRKLPYVRQLCRSTKLTRRLVRRCDGLERQHRLRTVRWSRRHCLLLRPAA